MAKDRARELATVRSADPKENQPLVNLSTIEKNIIDEARASITTDHMEGSSYESSFIDDEEHYEHVSSSESPEPGPPRKRAHTTTKTSTRVPRPGPLPTHLRSPYQPYSERPPTSTAQKKLQASLAGCLDRSVCSTWEKRSALFDTLNNHPATRRPYGGKQQEKKKK